jgi:hypothetical protein
MAQKLSASQENYPFGHMKQRTAAAPKEAMVKIRWQVSLRLIL